MKKTIRRRTEITIETHETTTYRLAATSPISNTAEDALNPASTIEVGLSDPNSRLLIPAATNVDETRAPESRGSITKE